MFGQITKVIRKSDHVDSLFESTTSIEIRTQIGQQIFLVRMTNFLFN